jgi:long-chain acyl-CoA synthetase
MAEYMNVCERFDRVARDSDEIAVHDPSGADKTYGQVRRESGFVAALLRDEGVEAQDRVGVYMQNCSAYVSTVLGVWRAGAIAVPLDERWDGDVTSQVLADLELSTLLTTDEYTDGIRSKDADGLLEDVPVALLDAEDTGCLGITAVDGPSYQVTKQLDEEIATIVYTSGTTGVPKGVIHTHRNVTAVIEMSIDEFEITASDVYLAAVPLSRSPGIYGSALPVLCAGGSVVVQTDWNPGEWVDLVERHRPRLSLLKPDHVRDVVSNGAAADTDTSSLDECIVTTGLLRSRSSVSDFREATDVDSFINYYGQTESLSISRGALEAERQPNFIGTPTSVVETKLVDPDTGRELGPGNAGELCIRGDVVSPGYWNRNRKAMKSFSDGWLHTGDRIRIDDDGSMYFQERLADQ